jgi:hypothetical protein
VITAAHPEWITKKHLDYFFTKLQDTSLVKNARILFQALTPVANCQPEMFDAYRAQLLHLVREQQDVCIFGCLLQYLIASVTVGGEPTAKENLNTLIDLLKDSNTSNEIRSAIFRGCQLIGVKHKQTLVARRSDLVAFESNATCQWLLEYIDGTTTTAEHQAAIKQAQDEMEHIGKRVVKTEQDVQQVTHAVHQQEHHVSISSYIHSRGMFDLIYR